MVLPIMAVALLAMIAVPYFMTRELANNELLVIVVGVVALAYVMKIAK